MLFNSVAFAIFFTVTVIVFYILPVKARWVWLLAASCFFYMYTHPVLVVIPFFIALVSFVCGIYIDKAPAEKTKQSIFLLAAIANLGILVFFKYTNFLASFFVDVANSIGHIFNSSGKSLSNPPLLNLLVPLGISYITFQALGYLIEVKNGNHAAEKNFGHFLTYILFFPKIISGPIERAHHFLPQIVQQKKFNYGQVTGGLRLMLWGFFKKLVIADRLLIYDDAVINNYPHHNGNTLLVASIIYSIQLYADFSGYTDIALGLAKILGFEMTQNFNRPFFAKSISEFWRKWHISLSKWFLDYVYNPIVISRRDWGKWSAVFGFTITFVLLGWWHGPNWTYIVFGLLQSIALCIEFLTRSARKKMRSKIPAVVNNAGGMIITFLFFCFSGIFFRANTVSDAFRVVKKISAFNGPVFFATPSEVIFCVLGILILFFVDAGKEFYGGRFPFFSSENWLVRKVAYAILIIIILIMGVFDGGQFIYFQF